MASKKPTPDQSTHDPEVRPKAARTHWSARDRLRILAAADACAPGELGALMDQREHLNRNLRFDHACGIVSIPHSGMGIA
ncbi:hypothetical protein [Herpetosiphon gulosus]|uniref:Transposase n=1 Tax=Herpetosiphon gulosus TaxID=1973496 RepID=A0ABP9X8Q8_9CHLR